MDKGERAGDEATNTNTDDSSEGLSGGVCAAEGYCRTVKRRRRRDENKLTNDDLATRMKNHAVKDMKSRAKVELGCKTQATVMHSTGVGGLPDESSTCSNVRELRERGSESEDGKAMREERRQCWCR